MQVEVPKFSQMEILYPGYNHFGGKYNNSRIKKIIGNQVERIKLHNTKSLRLSYALNRYSGRHAINNPSSYLVGKNKKRYIYRTLDFSKYLNKKYGEPAIITNLNKIQDKQGILIILSDRKRNYIGLWDCGKFFKSRGYFRRKHHIKRIEFWQSPGKIYNKNKKFQRNLKKKKKHL